jgi:hypothetical protein
MAVEFQCSGVNDAHSSAMPIVHKLSKDHDLVLKTFRLLIADLCQQFNGGHPGYSHHDIIFVLVKADLCDCVPVVLSVWLLSVSRYGDTLCITHPTLQDSSTGTALSCQMVSSAHILLV